MVAFFFLEGNMENEERRKKLIAALEKPVTNDLSVESFDPWHDIIEGILGSYSSSRDLIFHSCTYSVIRSGPALRL